jgi:hypothetical protein
VPIEVRDRGRAGSRARDHQPMRDGR